MRFYLVSLSAYSLLSTTLVVLLALQNRQMTRRNRPEPIDLDQVHELNLNGAPLSGPADAPITLVAFSDFHCPHCARGAGILTRLRDEHPDSIRLAFKHFPANGPSGRTAAKLALAAQRQGLFWQMHDYLFARDGELGEEAVAEAIAAVGLDEVQFRSDWQDPGLAAQIEEDFQEGLALGLKGTPTFFVNGVKVTGANAAAIQKVVGHFLAKAERAGT